jgi:cytochrome c
MHFADRGFRGFDLRQTRSLDPHEYSVQKGSGAELPRWSVFSMQIQYRVNLSGESPRWTAGMKRVLIALATGTMVALGPFSAAAQKNDAQRGESGAKRLGCLNCHDIEKKKVGPALQDSAGKFKSGNAAALAAAIKSRPIHAGAMKNVGDGQLEQIADWILTLKK